MVSDRTFWIRFWIISGFVLLGIFTGAFLDGWRLKACSDACAPFVGQPIPYRGSCHCQTEGGWRQLEEARDDG